MKAEETRWLLRLGLALTSLYIVLRNRPSRSR
jgi:hypothetical protein